MKRFWAVMNTTAARLSALYLALFAVCSVFLVVYMTGVAANFVITNTRDDIANEVRELDRSFQRGGMRRLVAEVERRARAPGANLYIITDSAGRIITGNVYALQPGVIDKTGWQNRPFAYARFGDNRNVINDDERSPRAIAQVVAMPNSMRLLVGRDIGEPERFRVVVRRSLTMALTIMGMGALLIWLFVGRRALARIDRMAAVSKRIMAGDLTGRLPVTSANDEFDRLSSNLNTMLERISTLNDGLRDVSDSIAHDLKTPLTRLRNRAEEALADAEKGKDTKAAVGDILSEADSLIRIFNSLLLISRVEAGYSKQSMDRVNLSDIASDIFELYEPTAEDAGATMWLSVADNAMVDGNRELIGQAVTNLVENAIKYGAPEKGGGEILVSVAVDGDRTTLSVCDNGAGIAEADRERVLKRFVRLDASRSAPGSGLGLSLVAAIMNLHGGALTLEDAAPGLKSTLSFPAKPA